MCMDKSGCEIYIPCASQETKTIAKAQQELRMFLNNQPGPEDAPKVG